MVTPPVRASGTVIAAGSQASAGEKEGFTSPWTAASLKPESPATPRPVPASAWISPGVTHFPVASTRMAPAGIATPPPTATTRPSRISTVPRSILGPETG